MRNCLREGGGSPLFLSELVRYSSDQRNASIQISLSVDLRGVILARIAQLAETERRLLEVVSLAGQPLDLAVASQAAGIASGFNAVVDQFLDEERSG